MLRLVFIRGYGFPRGGIAQRVNVACETDLVRPEKRYLIDAGINLGQIGTRMIFPGNVRHDLSKKFIPVLCHLFIFSV